MTGPLNRTPSDLNQYLGVKGTGSNIPSVVDSVQPVIDVRPFFESELIARIGVSGNLGSVPNGTTAVQYTVQAAGLGMTNSYFIRNVTVTFTAGAATDVIGLCWPVYAVGVSQFRTVGTPYAGKNFSAIGQNHFVGFDFNRIVRTADLFTIGVYVDSAVSAGVTLAWSVAAEIYRFAPF